MITTSELDAICTRHGKVYTATISPEGTRPQIFLKFRDAPEVEEERQTSTDMSSIKDVSVDTVTAGISEAFGGVCTGKKGVRSTWTLTFDVRTVTMQQCTSLRQHSSNAIIDVFIKAGAGIVVVYAEKTDTKTSLR
jgi:hypothetical protein